MEGARASRPGVTASLVAQLRLCRLRIRRVCLSLHNGSATARRLAKPFRSSIGRDGGRKRPNLARNTGRRRRSNAGVCRPPLGAERYDRSFVPNRRQQQLRTCDSCVHRNFRHRLRRGVRSGNGPARRGTGSAHSRNVVVAEFRGSITLKSGGRYDNRYVGIFAFNDDGLLAHYTEYFDPFELLSGFPGAREMRPDGPQEALRLLPQLTGDRDWERLETLFADKVGLDYTSLEGGDPKILAPRELVATWRRNLSRFDSTKHYFSVPRCG